MNVANDIMMALVGTVTTDMSENRRQLRYADTRVGFNKGFEAGVREGIARAQNMMKESMGVEGPREDLYSLDYFKEIEDEVWESSG
jgi:hypothetical protein